MKVQNAFRALRIMLLALMLGGFAPALLAADEPAPAKAEEAAAVAAPKPPRPTALYVAIAASIGIGCMSAAYAVGKIGAAVMGAAAEKPEIMGKAIAFVGLGEGIALFGFLIALFLYTKV